MNLFGIFDLNQNYKLLNYSTQEQGENIYEETDPVTKQTHIIHTICLSGIEYSDDYIGKFYDPSTGTFS